MMTNKKGAQQMWWIIASAVIAILIVIFLIVWFKGSGEKAYGGIGEKLDGLGDYDNDGTADMFDKCPCDNSIGDKWPEENVNKVCPTPADTCNQNRAKK